MVILADKLFPNKYWVPKMLQEKPKGLESDLKLFVAIAFFFILIIAFVLSSLSISSIHHITVVFFRYSIFFVYNNM